MEQQLKQTVIMAHSQRCSSSLLSTVLGLPLFLLDIGLDVLAAVRFYQEGSYVCLGVLLLLLIGSSLLVQVFSWLWYKYEDLEMTTEVEICLKPSIRTLHVFQLGIYVRHAGVLETSLRNCFSPSRNTEDHANFLSHDLAMLRIIETFSESAPQIVLMLAVILQEGRLEYFTVLKTIGSMSVVAFCVTTYHCSLRSFLPEKKKQSKVSSIVYFLWNLLLLSSRLVALSLFSSVLPYFIFAHFFCSWLLLFFFAWRSKTDFMDCSFGEWLFRAIVGLIWYFDWFNVVEGKTGRRMLLYHSYILTDICVLCGVWFWKMSTDPPVFGIPQLYAAIVASCVVGVYILGLTLKLVYYKFFHPNLQPDEVKEGSSQTVQEDPQLSDEVDIPPNTERVEMDSGAMGNEEGGRPHLVRTAVVIIDDVTDRCMPTQSERCNKRMKKLAENFYSSR